MKDIKVLIVSDVHGRDFWREPVKYVLENMGAHIVFLGDYTDCYPHEWEGTGINPQEHAIEIFKQVIDTKKLYPERVTLLIGNHKVQFVF